MKAVLSKNVQKRLNSEEEKFLASEEYQVGQRQLNEAETSRVEQQEEEQQEEFLEEAEKTLSASMAATSISCASPVSKAEADDVLVDLQQAPPSVSRTNSSSSEPSH